MVRSALLATALLASFCASSAQAQSLSNDETLSAYAQTVSGEDGTASGTDNRLMIVSRYTGRVIYNDGRNDLFCATGFNLAGYNYYGRPVYRRTMHCR